MRDDAASAHQAFLQRERFASLDGLRALGVVAVVWFHTMGDGLDGQLRYAGAHGVTLFFAISGFLITTLLIREHQRNGRIDLKAFYVRRVLRIFPLYFAVLGVYVVAVAVVETGPDGAQFFRNLPFFLTYTTNLFVALDGRVIFYFSWSLAAEEQFYATWPALMRAFGTVARASLMVAMAVALLLLLELVTYDEPPSKLSRFVHGVPLAILLGVLSALLLADRSMHGRLWRMCARTRWHSCAYLLLALVVTGWTDSPRLVLHAVLTLLVVACVLREDHVLGRLLTLPAVMHVGAVSYCIYLVHMLSKNAVVALAAFAGINAPDGAVFVATLGVSILVATLSYRYFESYFLSLKHRFAR